MTQMNNEIANITRCIFCSSTFCSSADNYFTCYICFAGCNYSTGYYAYNLMMPEFCLSIVRFVGKQPLIFLKQNYKKDVTISDIILTSIPERIFDVSKNDFDIINLKNNVNMFFNKYLKYNELL